MTHEREYLRVTPSGGSFTPQQAPDTITSLHKLGADDSTSILTALVPFASQQGTSPTFEFVALSAGADEPVEFYYGIDQPEHLDTLEQRLTAIYPTTFDIERVERDLVARLLRPVEYDREEFVDRLEQERLYYEPDADAVKAEGETETDGQDVDTGSDQENERSPTATDGGPAAADPSRIDYDGGSPISRPRAHSRQPTRCPNSMDRPQPTMKLCSPGRRSPRSHREPCGGRQAASENGTG